ncbi:MAG TPA: helix-turn-helix domain-containing protein [Bacillota bacterium]|nr:helix-turn-helix domain-containing protein [Bacillota bacterium]
MELGNKIKQLRYRSGLTQEQLAERLGLSAQAVSKWENAVSMPDVTLLPQIAEEFGVSIDELFDLSSEQRLRRIENRMDVEAELGADVFREYEDFLKDCLQNGEEREKVLSLLAYLYHHRMQADAQKVSRYAREAMRLRPEKKDCQWLLDKAEGQVVWDWNVANHSGVIDFYKELIASDKIEPRTPLPYFYLIDNLIADRRTEEAKNYLKAFAKLPAHKKFMVPVYEAHIALAEFDEKKADGIMEKALTEFANDGGFLFEKAQYHAKKCEYEKAIECYEASYASEEDAKPRFADALHGIAIIYEIMGDNKKAADIYERIIENLKTEWGLSEEISLKDAERERDRLLKK